MKRTQKSGFTLIEMSIVLVIIGLIVGGILVGRDLIRAAEVRQTVGQYERFNVAVNTFKGKYNCLPGDCVNATQFGFTSIRGTTSQANGDGDGKINGDGGSYPNDSSSTENTNFWVHLMQSKLISDHVDYPVDTSFFCSGQVGSHSPTSSLVKRNSGSCVYTYTSGGWWVLSALYLNSASPAYLQFPGNVYTLSNCVISGCGGTPVLKTQDSYAIDAKIDDGYPQTGTVRAYKGRINGSFYAPLMGSAGSAVCVNTDATPYVYNVANISDYYCGLVLQAPF